MIRTEDTITNWQKYFARDLNYEMRTKILTSQALIPVERAFFTEERSHNPIYSDWYGNGRPVAIDSQVSKRELKVIYSDFDMKQYYIGSDGKLKKQPYNAHNRDVLPWEIPMEADRSWHQWAYITNYDVLMKKMSENTSSYLFTFLDAVTATRYAFHTYVFGYKV